VGSAPILVGLCNLQSIVKAGVDVKSRNIRTCTGQAVNWKHMSSYDRIVHISGTFYNQYGTLTRVTLLY
jgi:hypothetical protein